MHPWYLRFEGGKYDTSFEGFFKRFQRVRRATDLKICNRQLSRNHRNARGEKQIRSIFHESV